MRNKNKYENHLQINITDTEIHHKIYKYTNIIYSKILCMWNSITNEIIIIGKNVQPEKLNLSN